MTDFAYRRDIAKTQMARYAEKWAGLPMPRLQLRWAPKPVPKREYRTEQAQSDRMCKLMGYAPQPQVKWDCFYELILPVDKYDIRNEHYDVGFIIIPISWCRRGSSRENTPCQHGVTDTPFRDGAHAYWDSKELNWLPIFVVAPDGSAQQKTDYFDAPAVWKSAEAA